jgi:hypothetical protein
MSGEIDHLWTLHGLDEQLAALNAKLAGFPAQKQSLERHVDEEKTRLEALKKQLADQQLKRRAIEKDIEDATVQERKFASQLPAVKKNEEYQALLHEIAGSKSKRSDLETGVLESLEEEERLAGARPKIEAALKAAEAERAQQLASIDQAETDARTGALKIDEARAVEIAGLTAPTRARYERVFSSRDGRAVVAILKGACGGCFRGQPPQVLQEARKRDRLLICENCGRLLVLPPEGAVSAS